jgi:hypothetical protein
MTKPNHRVHKMQLRLGSFLAAATVSATLVVRHLRGGALNVMFKYVDAG